MTTAEQKLIQTDFRLCKRCNKLHTGLSSCPTCADRLDPVDTAFFLEKSLGKYKIEKLLGIGGMGVVFQGIHETLHKKAAIKIFIPNEEDASFAKRFLREARILADLKHPNIIEVYDFDISDWGTPFYVMEYLEGRTLRDVISEYPRGLPQPMVADLLEPVIHGLSHAHKKGIVHRDLKPANIFIEKIHGKDILKILDFGIAKRVDEGPHAPANEETTTRAVMGTPYYITPEQILNKNIGPHTDQYALAMIAAEMLTGRVIRAGKTVGEILYKEAHDTVRLKNEKHIPQAAKDALTRATAPEPSKRFRDIETFGEALIRSLRKQRGKKNITDTLQATQPIYEPARETHKLLPVLIILAAVVIIASAIFIFKPFEKIESTSSGEPKPTAEAGQTVPLPFPVPVRASQPLLTLQSTINTPADTAALLSFRDKSLVLLAGNGIYLVDADPVTPGPTQAIPLEEKIIGGLPGGNVVFIDDFAITSRNFIDGSDNLILRNPPPAEKYRISRSQKYIVAQKENVLTIYRLENQKHSEIKAITIPPTKSEAGLTWEISNKYLVFSHSGRIYGNLLETGDEILNLPFSATGELPSAITILRNGHLAAAAGAGEDPKVYIYDLKKAALLQTAAEPGPTMAIAFLTLPGSASQQEEPQVSALDKLATESTKSTENTSTKSTVIDEGDKTVKTNTAEAKKPGQVQSSAVMRLLQPDKQDEQNQGEQPAEPTAQTSAPEAQPILVTAKEGRLLFLAVQKNKTNPNPNPNQTPSDQPLPLYQAVSLPGLQVTNMLVTEKGLLLLDKTAGKIHLLSFVQAIEKPSITAGNGN